MKTSIHVTELQKLTGPVVYIFRQDDKVLYVGRSIVGLSRPFSTTHRKAQRCMGMATSLEVIPCESLQEAIAMEMKKIRELDPAMNGEIEPREPGETGQTRLSFLLDEDTLEQLKEMATKERENVSSFIRRLIRADAKEKGLMK